MKRTVVVLALALSMFGASNACAQGVLGIRSAGVAAGWVSPENLDGTFSFGVFADHGNIAPRWSLESHVDYWGWSESAFGAETSVNDITFGLRTKYHFMSTNPKFDPYAGFGLGMHFIGAEATMAIPGFPTTTVEDSQTKLGLDLGGGMAMSVSPRTDLLGELWYGVVSDVSQFSLRCGLSYKFGN